MKNILAIPFNVGTPIYHPADFMGRHEAIDKLIRAMTLLENVSIQGERRTGKTSILLYASHPKSDIAIGIPANHIPVYIDFQPLTKLKLVEIWSEIVRKIADQTMERNPENKKLADEFQQTIKPFLKEVEIRLIHLGLTQAFEHYRQANLKINLLFDEFDLLVNNREVDDSFFNILRSFVNERDPILSYVISTRAGLESLQQVTARKSSPFANVFTTYRVGRFTSVEVEQIITNYLSRIPGGEKLADNLLNELSFLYDLTGFHPYFLQNLCYHLCAYVDEPQWPRSASFEDALAAYKNDISKRFAEYWKFSSEEEKYFLKELVDKPQELTPQLKVLQDRALIVPSLSTDNVPKWQLVSPFFAEWIQSEHKVSAKYFICYHKGSLLSTELADYIKTELLNRGHDVDCHSHAEISWGEEIEQSLRESDYLFFLLEQNAASSESIQFIIERAYQYHKRQGKPKLITARVGYDDVFPYSISKILNSSQVISLGGEQDKSQILNNILHVLALEQPERTISPKINSDGNVIVSEDGHILFDVNVDFPPLPEFDPRLLDELVAPGGTVKLRDTFYISRDHDKELQRQVMRPGTITTIRAPRQTGKSSMLVRGLHHAQKNGLQTILIDLQSIERDYLQSYETFLHYIATHLVRKLRLNLTEVDKAWQGPLGVQDKLTYLLEDSILPKMKQPIVLGIDEADRLVETNYHTNFFGLIRSWHNSAAYNEIWEKLVIVLVIATEPYLLIADINQSPFNVGTKLYLKDFSSEQVRDLNQRHNSPVSDEHFAEFYDLVGGQPYLTRRALYTLANENVGWETFFNGAATDGGPFADHLRRQLWLLREEPELQATLKQAILGEPCQNEAARFRLLRGGLIKSTGDVCECRCDLYRRYFADKLLR